MDLRYKNNMSNVKRRLLFTNDAVKETLSKIKTMAFMNKKQLLTIILDNQKSFVDDLGIVVIVKNEALYILEWIEYHRILGFSKFYIYDNDSTDNIEEIFSPYIEGGIVIFQKIHGAGKQLFVYDDAVQKAKYKVRWLAIIDADEFIQNLTDKPLLSILEQHRQVAQLFGWMIFGSNGKKERRSGLVIERFTKHATDDFIADYKMILNPRKVLKFINPHYAQMFGLVRDEKGKIIHSYPYHTVSQAIPAPKKLVRINHYYSKSLEEFNKKSKRGFADNVDDNLKRTDRAISDFTEHDRNEVEDFSMQKFVPEINKRLLKYSKDNNL